MNFLAHLYLSGNNEQVMVGNFIADWVKGKRFDGYPHDIQRGIRMHRQIDSYTDSHPLVKETITLFRPSYGRYAGIVSDIVFDHYLSINWHRYSNTNRIAFIDNVHSILQKYEYFAPGRSRSILPSLIYHGWLYHYISFYGIEKVLSRMAYRTTLPEQSRAAMEILRQNYDTIGMLFEEFFEDLRLHVVQY